LECLTGSIGQQCYCPGLRTEEFEMDADQLSSMTVSLLGEISAVSSRDLWTWQGVIAAGCMGLSMALWRWIGSRRRASLTADSPPRPATALFNRVGTAALLCALALVGYLIRHTQASSAGLLLIVVLLSAAMVISRLAVYGVMRAKNEGALIPMVEQAAGWAVWLAIVLLSLKWITPVSNALDANAITVGSIRISLLDGIRTIVILLLFIVVAAWVGSFVERRIMALGGLPIGVRVGVGKVTRVFLVVLAVLLALTSVGVDLTALTVIGGAVGVGLGFGLQRIASNFISGFVLLGDRSIRPGDVITIGTRFGVVRELRARYVVVRDRDGVDTLIPNESLITSEVINWSYGDRRIRLKLPVRISYQDNPRRAMSLMEGVAKTHPRVEGDPAPAARVMEFSEVGIELELRFWIRDPEDGVNNVRSDLFLAIWDAFATEGITIPYPQQVVHLKDPG
jgi:small-conductance mechanosensitive channel